MHIFVEKISEREVDQLKQIAIQTFRQSYEHLNTASNFKSYLAKSFTGEKLLQEIRNKNCFFYFVKFDKAIAGYLKLNIGNSQTEKHSDEYLEIERIYLEANYQRKGIGKQMIEFAVTKAKELQKTKIWLGVWDKNPQAIHFYKKMGFRCTGSHIFKFGNENQIDILMELNISDI